MPGSTFLAEVRGGTSVGSTQPLSRGEMGCQQSGRCLTWSRPQCSSCHEALSPLHVRSLGSVKTAHPLGPVVPFCCHAHFHEPCMPPQPGQLRANHTSTIGSQGFLLQKTALPLVHTENAGRAGRTGASKLL